MKFSTQAQRRARLYQSIEDGSVAFLFSGAAKQRSGDQDYPFSVDRNFFYLTGLDEPGDILVITKQKDEVKERLFVPRPDPARELYYGKMPTADEHSERTGIESVFYRDRFDEEMGRLLSRGSFGAMYMDFHQRELGEGAMPENGMARHILAAHPYLTPQNLSPAIAGMRRIKTPDEVADIREAIRITGLGIDAILRHMAPGVWENELQAHFEFTLKSAGCRETAFPPIIAGGANSVVLHYEHNNCQISDGDLLLLDLGAEYNHYSGDISRTFPVGGAFTPRQLHFYKGVLAAQNAVAAALRPGLKMQETLDIARDALFDCCAEAGVAKDKTDMETLLPHGVCHYLGLDTHDVGERDTLAPGMVLTIEPGVYLPDLGFGIRIEDDALITEDGCEILSPQILKTPEEIGAFLAEVR